MVKARNTNRNGTVQSLSRALKLLEILSEAPSGMSLKEAAALGNLPPSTAHRLLSTLQDQGFVRFDQAGLRWRVGVRAFTVGQSFLAGRDIVELTVPFLRRLMEETEETANLGLLSGQEIVILSQVECRQAMRALARPGSRAPLHCSGIGKALLAAQGAEPAKKTLGRTKLQSFTVKTRTNFDALWNDLKGFADKGYVFDDEEHQPGLRCVAGCIFDENGWPAAGMSVSGPSVRIPSDRMHTLGVRVAEICAQATAEFGGQKPAQMLP